MGWFWKGDNLFGYPNQTYALFRVLILLIFWNAHLWNSCIPLRFIFCYGAQESKQWIRTLGVRMVTLGMGCLLMNARRGRRHQHNKVRGPTNRLVQFDICPLTLPWSICLIWISCICRGQWGSGRRGVKQPQ
jgi:hypothetical protein